MRRTETVDVRVGRKGGRLPRPNLLGAILVKARAVGIDDAPENQRADLALLLSLVIDAAELATHLARRERTWLRRRTEMDDPSAAYWAAMDPASRQRGLAAFRVLADLHR